MLKSKMLSYSLCIFSGELVAHSPSVSFADSSLTEGALKRVVRHRNPVPSKLL